MSEELLYYDENEPIERWYRDLFGAIGSGFLARLYDCSSESDIEILNGLKERAQEVQTIQEYLKEKMIQAIEVRKKYKDPSFTADPDEEVGKILCLLDEQRVQGFNQIAEEIREMGKCEQMDVAKLKQLVLREFEILYGTDHSDYEMVKRNLGL